MEPSSDPSLHFHHHPGQRHQRLGRSQPSGSMSAASNSHAQGPASPSASTAASSNPFVRSHHDEVPAPSSAAADQTAAAEAAYHRHRSEHASSTTEADLSSSSVSLRSTSLSRAASTSSLSRTDSIPVAIKCPSLDKDSAVVSVKPSDTVLALKQTIERSWPGAPRAEGMRCIRSGRILDDDEILGQLVEGLEAGVPLSLHLVIRPDAWSDPQNRPTPSRRSSYLRQQHLQQQQQQQQQSLLRAALGAQISTAPNVDDDVPPVHSSTSNVDSSNWTPQFEPYFSEPISLPTQVASGSRADDTDTFASNSVHNMMTASTDQQAADTYAFLEKTLRVTAPDNWPMLVQALSTACDEYVLMYESVYNQAQAARNSDSRPESDISSTSLSPQSTLLTSVETILLGWDPISLPVQSHTATSSSPDDPTEYMYQQVSHRGLPYLLRIAASPLDMQRSEALHALLQRISTLRTMMDKLENVIMLGRLIQVQSPNVVATTGANGATIPTQLNGAAAAGRAMALEQGGMVSSITRLAQSALQAVRGITFADVTAVVVPMFFVGFKVGILLSVMLRGADTFKKYFVLGMASIYVAFEGFRIFQRRMRVRQRMGPRAPVPVPAAPQQPEQQQQPQPQPQQAGAHPAAGAQQPVSPADAAAAAETPAPMGANVPSAPSHEESVERQATENPHQPLPPPQAPLRIRSQTRFAYDWWIDHLAFIGLDAEDAELGLLPPPLPAAGTNANGGEGTGPGAQDHHQRRATDGWWWRVESILSSSWILPVVLFFTTMMPAVEQRRKRAIEERERVIRKWTRLEAERRQRVEEMFLQQQQQVEKEKEAVTPRSEIASHALTTQASGAAEVQNTDAGSLQQKRADYADRILRQRRTNGASTAAAVAMDDEDQDRDLGFGGFVDDDADGEMEDMNIF